MSPGASYADFLVAAATLVTSRSNAERTALRASVRRMAASYRTGVHVHFMRKGREGMGDLARVGGAVASVVALVVGLLGLVDSWPRWLLIALGVAGLVGIIFEFFWARRSGGEQRVINVRQKQKGGAGSQNWQAGRDIRVGGMGDRRE
jgi:hypothetical protein